METARRAMQPAKKPIQPASRAAAGQSHAQKKTFGRATHGGNVAHGSRPALSADGIRGVTVNEKMRPVQKPVTGQNKFITGGGTKQGGVVANTHRQAAPLQFFSAEDSADKAVFIVNGSRHRFLCYFTLAKKFCRAPTVTGVANWREGSRSSNWVAHPVVSPAFL